MPGADASQPTISESGIAPTVAAHESLNESYLAVSGSVPRARQAVAGFAASVGLDGERLDDVRLAVSEAVTNAVKHAYRGREGQVHVSVAVASGELLVLVSDSGCGHQTAAENPGLGVGLALMANTCDDLKVVERPEGGTEARMRFLI